MSRWIIEIDYIMFLSKLLQWPEWHLEKQSNFPGVVYKTPGDQDIAYFSSHILPLFVPHHSTQIPILWPHQAGNSLFTYGEFHLGICIICTNISSWTSQNADPWLKQNQLQIAYNHAMNFKMGLETFISCLKTKKSHHLSLPWKFWFLIYKMNRWSPKRLSESLVQIFEG